MDSHSVASLPPASWAHAVLRLAFGVNIAGHGFVRLMNGIVAFADQMAAGFEHTAMPTTVARLFGLMLPPIELTIGVLILFGALLRPTLVAGGLFMAALVFGTTLQQKWDVLGVQLVYSIKRTRFSWTQK